jgi:hypothetical protein
MLAPDTRSLFILCVCGFIWTKSTYALQTLGGVPIYKTNWANIWSDFDKCFRRSAQEMGLYAASFPGARSLSGGMNTVIFFVVRLRWKWVNVITECVCIYICVCVVSCRNQWGNCGLLLSTGGARAAQRRDDADSVIGRNFYLSC